MAGEMNKARHKAKPQKSSEPASDGGGIRVFGDIAVEFLSAVSATPDIDKQDPASGTNAVAAHYCST
jgi:hypothetical protein